MEIIQCIKSLILNLMILYKLFIISIIDISVTVILKYFYQLLHVALSLPRGDKYAKKHQLWNTFLPRWSHRSKLLCTLILLSHFLIQMFYFLNSFISSKVFIFLFIYSDIWKIFWILTTLKDIWKSILKYAVFY